jgi:Leucine Rich Repeat (LRR) protein
VVRTLRRLGVAASLLIWIATLPLAADQSKKSPDSPKKFVFLLPDGFKGWVCVDFGVAGAEPLEHEGDTFVIRPHQGEVLATSDKPDAPFLYGEAWFEVEGKRSPLQKDVTLQPGISRTGSAELTERQCAFVGTQDERDAAPDAPGFEKTEKGKAIPQEEREALEALYEATDGEHWMHRVGWLGPPGTECGWHGVGCGSGRKSSVNVVDLDLYENNLVGSIPGSIGRLRSLQSLDLGGNHLTGAIPDTLGRLRDLEGLTLFGNHLSGTLPDPLIQRWLAGPLDISAEASLLSDVSEIDFEARSSSVLCASHRVILRSNETAISYTERCRAATPGDRTTFCEVKNGRVGAAEFARLGWLIKKNGFFGLKPEYYRNTTDAGFENTRVTENGKPYAVSDYADGGPFELWVIENAIEGVAANAEWENTSTQRECPRW